MATVSLYSVETGDYEDFELSVDQNGDIVADSDGEILKFPGNLSKTELQKLFNAHNEANEGVVALTDEEIEEQEGRVDKAQSLLDSLEDTPTEDN